MGTKVQTENYLPGDYSMRDVSREANGANWPSCYGDSSLPNGQFHYGFMPRTVTDVHPGYDKDVVKQTMLEHEVIFKDQVYELHRLYRVQRDLMDEVRRKEQLKRRIPYEASSSSSPLPAQMQPEDPQRWNGSNFTLASPVSGRPLISGPGAQAVPSPSPSPYQNCYSSKTSEVSESRPTKFRKGMLDLQLPADEYIDTDEVEQFGRTKDFENISSSPDKNRKPTIANGKMFLGYPRKTECQGYASSSDVHFSKPRALADLNEPLHVEETTKFSSVDFLGQAVSRNDVSYRDHSTRLLSSSMDVPESSRKSSMNGMKRLQNIRANGQDWFSYALQSEHNKGIHQSSMNQGIHPEKVPVPSQPMHILLDQTCQTPSFVPIDHIKGEPWKPKSIGITEKSDCSYAFSGYSQPGLFRTPDLGKSWGQPTTSFGKPNILTPNPTSIQRNPLQLSYQSNGMVDNKWNLNNTPIEPPVRNGFYQGSSTAFMEQAARCSPAGTDYANYNSEKTVPFSSSNSLKTSSCINVNPVNEMNLNVALPNSVSDEYTSPRPVDPLASLPWIRGKGVASSSCEVGAKAKKPENSRKILGVPIFDNPPDNHHPTEEIVSSKRKNFFDINVPCEPIDSDLDNISVNKVVVNHFDLNSCIMEEETPCGTSLLCSTSSVKVGTGIDLEAPATFENEDIILPVEDPLIEVQPESIQDIGDADLIKSAASTIVAISSVEVTTCLPLEVEGNDPLDWFVSIACSSGNEDVVDIPMVRDDGLPEGLDDFEYTILRLKECSIEEYFPTPSIPDFSIAENGTCALTTKTRKGPGRRGRQRRDFQRDILPGLTTLSRHEVTEDLQTFGGLMRATGYSWHSGPNRRNATRNGRGRGRRRAIVETDTPVVSDTVCALPLKQVHGNNMEVGLEDRSLTGWGKTTRRPRRQRCPAGNPNPSFPVALT